MTSIVNTCDIHKEILNGFILMEYERVRYSLLLVSCSLARLLFFLFTFGRENRIWYTGEQQLLVPLVAAAQLWILMGDNECDNRIFVW